MEPSESAFEHIYQIARRIPQGRVTTYGRIARALGGGVGPRDVGRALASLPTEHDVPTHRVVNARGKPLCPRGRGSLEAQQQELAREGVPLDDKGRVPLDSLVWEP
jgi:methylated-DNA-protein-cysteine methyltransferase-like protein